MGTGLGEGETGAGTARAGPRAKGPAEVPVGYRRGEGSDASAQSARAPEKVPKCDFRRSGGVSAGKGCGGTSIQAVAPRVHPNALEEGARPEGALAVHESRDGTQHPAPRGAGLFSRRGEHCFHPQGGGNLWAA